jgi:pyruvate formate lyase activating enzyme
MDDKKHALLTGKSNEKILANLKKLAETEKGISIRIPLISRVNDDDQNIRQMAEFLVSIKNKHRINLLPYHDGGSEKRKRQRKDPGGRIFRAPSPQRIKRIKKMLSESGFSVSIGG